MKSYFPEFPERPREIESIHLTELGSDELVKLASDLTASVNQPETRNLLESRHLLGVIARHTDHKDSLKNVLKARKNTERITAMATFALRHTDSDTNQQRWAGMSTIMPLSLRKPRFTPAGLLPAKITKSSQLLSEEVHTRGRNVTAWLDADHATIGNLATAYSDLLSLGGAGLWTIEPGHLNETDSAKALELSGMRGNPSPARYDDGEAGHTPPVSTLYQYYGSGHFDR